MTRLIYIANIRLPTEKAHGLQIMQNCEAFADTGAQVTLWVARRVNTPDMRAIPDVWAHYGVKRNFDIQRIPCLDLLPLIPARLNWLTRLAFYLQSVTFAVAMLLRALFSSADIYYSRDPLPLFILSFFKPYRKLVYEAHMLASGRGGRTLQQQVVRRIRSGDERAARRRRRGDSDRSHHLRQTVWILPNRQLRHHVLRDPDHRTQR